MQIRDDGKVIVGPSPNPNLFANPQLFGVPAPWAHWPTVTDPPTLAISTGNITLNTAPPTPGSATGWSHLCLVVHYSPTLGDASVQFYLNGCLDMSGTGLNLTAGANMITPTWFGNDSSELCISQFIICDKAGSVNNTNVSQFAQIQTVFPSSDVLTGWSGGYALVDGNPGPGLTFITLPSLAQPDNLFGIPPLSATPQVLGVATSMCISGPGQTLTGLFKKFGKIAYSLTPPLSPLAYTVPPSQTGNISGFYTRQTFLEIDPWTSAPLLISDINAAAWGLRGLIGTGEDVSQYFLEVLCQTGPAVCGGGSYAYGQTG